MFVICYDKSEIVTICNHEYCSNCINRLYTLDIDKCSYCRRPFNDDLFYIDNIIDD